MPAVTPVSTDEIYEKYLKKAIAEINDLGHEIAAAGKGERVPVLGSGHPRADVFLLKHRPQPAEIQEGVAFFGRSGQALLKSLQRLNIDPLSIYGTNCLKFADEHDEEARPFLIRELHIVAAEARRGHGRGRARVPERARLPARRELEPRRAQSRSGRRRSRRSTSPTSTPRSTSSPRRHDFGTHSKLSAPGGPNCRRTSSLRRARRLLPRRRVAAEPLALGGGRVPLRSS